MIFCKSRGFIYLRVPKTASTSLSLQILDKIQLQPGDFSTRFGAPSVGWVKPIFNGVVSRVPTPKFQIDEHAWLQVAVYRYNLLKEEDIEKYSVYGFLREPTDRFFSMFTHFFDISGQDVSKMTKEQIALKGLQILKEAKVPYQFVKNTADNTVFPFYKQCEWLLFNGKPINNIILYPNFDEFLTKVTGSAEFKFREKIGKKPMHSEVSQSILDEIREWYADDFELWERFSRGRSPAQ